MGLLVLLCCLQDPDLPARLTSGGWAAVEQAAKEPARKEQLQALAKSPDPELRWWAGAALAELEARERAGSHYLEPLRVTLEVKDQLAEQVLRDLLAKVNLRLGRSSATPSAVTASFKDTPLLVAIDEVCRQAGVSLYSRAGGEVQVTRGSPPTAASFHTGHLSGWVTGLIRTTEVDFEREPATRLTLTACLRLDPRLRTVRGDPQWTLVSAVDDTGKSLLLAEKGGPPRYLHWQSGRLDRGSTLQTELALPAPGAKAIARLRGTASVTLALKTEEVAFEKVLSGEAQTRELGGIRATLRKCERTAEGYAVELELAGLKEGTRGPTFEEIVLEDSAGKPLARGGGSSGGTSTKLQFRDRAGAGPAERLRFPLATRMYSRQLYFEIKDVPLE